MARSKITPTKAALNSTKKNKTKAIAAVRKKNPNAPKYAVQTFQAKLADIRKGYVERIGKECEETLGAPPLLTGAIMKQMIHSIKVLLEQRVTIGSMKLESQVLRRVSESDFYMLQWPGRLGLEGKEDLSDYIAAWERWSHPTIHVERIDGLIKEHVAEFHMKTIKKVVEMWNRSTPSVPCTIRMSHGAHQVTLDWEWGLK